MAGMTRPLRDQSAILSVIVPIYRVEDYLLPCLESIADQSLRQIEVVLVDDGSPDSSGAMADNFAAGRSGWSVLHVPNGGLGRARNIGLDHSSAPFVAFVDSDDIVLPDAYEMLVHAAVANDSDFASGGVLRYDGSRTFPSPLHRRAIPTTRMATHIREQPSLINDTTAWNKVFRREFLSTHGLRFPEGILYEDIPLTLPAHFLARSVSMLEDPVYLWRERQTAELSITQRRAELRNLEDRMAAITMVDDFLRSHHEVEGKRLHDLKVLKGDIPLYLDVVPSAEDKFVGRLVELVGAYLEDVPTSVTDQLNPPLRLSYELIRRRLPEKLQEAQAAMQRPGATRHVTRRGRKLYADLPFREDPDLQIPERIYDLTRSQRLVTGVRDVFWSGGHLYVDGHAFVDRVPDLGVLSSIRRFQLRLVGGDADERHTVPAKRVRRPDVTGRTTGAAVNYTGAGFLARIARRLLRLPTGIDEAELELIAQVATPVAQRGWSVGGPQPGRALHAERVFVGSDVLAIPWFRAQKFRVLLRRVPAVITGLFTTEAALRITLRRIGGSSLDGWWLHLRREDSRQGVSVPLLSQPEGWIADIQLDCLDLHAESLTDRRWSIVLVENGGAGPLDPDEVTSLATVALRRAPSEPHRSTVGDRRVVLLNLDAGVHVPYSTAHGRGLLLNQTDRGAVLVESPPTSVLTDFSFSSDGLCLTGALAGTGIDGLFLIRGSERLEVPVRVTGDSWTALIPATGEPGTAVLRWLSEGSWRLATPSPRSAALPTPVRVAGEVRQRLGQEWGDPVRVQVRANRLGEFILTVDNGGSWNDRGKYNQERARLTTYRIARRRPLRDTILFQAWKGRQFSDSPRAIFEELLRQQDERELIWVIEHYGVEVPDGVRTVLAHSTDYFKELGRARWVISNDSMPAHFVKRSGMRYGQTWHGTPLKRIGFDIENLQMANPNYLKQFAKEVAKWDVLVSPNSFSTEIFSRAFAYDGPILEIGYPRNDIFFQEEARKERAQRIRKRLGLPGDRPVILYAPTWRDNHYDRGGRYQFALKLDLERMRREIGEEAVLLIRGHQLVAHSLDVSRLGGFVRNVSLYPDIADLYLIADVLITDYSSVMFDYANTGRPMLFFTYDLNEYRDQLRGFYFDFEAEAPGPLLSCTDEVIAALQNLESVRSAYSDRYAAFRQRFTGMEDGHASSRFIDAFLQRS